VRRGSLRMLFTNMSCLKRYVCCTLLGLPIWFIVGLIMTFSPEIGRALGIPQELKTATAILYFYGGIIAGDLASGLISQFLQSRKKALAFFILGSCIGTLVILNLSGTTDRVYYNLCAITGFFSGYWAVFLTTTAEHFGTNLRATVTTSIPNLVRGGAIVLSSAFALLKPAMGVVGSLQLLTGLTFVAALIALSLMRETFGISLDFTEEDVEKSQVV
jgi:hypothetical protein